MSEQAASLAERLRAASVGRDEWRVQNPKDGSYCIAFSDQDGFSFDPERDARGWLEDHIKHFPNSQFAGHEVACVRVFTCAERLMLEAADEIERLAAAKDQHFAQAMKNGEAAQAAQRRCDDLRRALEVIAVGDAKNPQAQAVEELIALGYWRDIPEARALAAWVIPTHHSATPPSTESGMNAADSIAGGAA